MKQPMVIKCPHCRHDVIYNPNISEYRCAKCGWRKNAKSKINKEKIQNTR